MGHIFLSYARADGREYVEQLDQDLQQAGYQTWWDKRTLDPYQDFSAEIEVGIRESDFVVVCITPSVHDNPSSFVRREIIYADTVKKRIIPLIFPNAIPLILINHLTWIAFYEAGGQRPHQTLDYQQGWTSLITRLQDNEHFIPRPSNDPFKEYLQGMYEFIVNYLKQTVFSLVDLKGIETPDAIENSHSQTLPVSFMQVMLDMAGLAAPAANPTEFQNFHEAFEHYNGRVLLLGEPGAGKTTTLLAFARDKIAARLADPNQPLPLYAPIVTWDAQAKIPFDEWFATASPQLYKEIKAEVKAGKALMILDGLDELGREREDKDNKEKYDPRHRFVATIPANNHIVISSRIKDYEEIGSKVPFEGALTLQPLDDTQLELYFQNFKLPQLWAALQADAELKEVARTPLLLSLFTVAFQNADAEMLASLEGKIGNELRDHIFETYITERYNREARKPNTKITVELFELKQWLGKLAMESVIPHSVMNFPMAFFDYVDSAIEVQTDYDIYKELLDLAQRLHLLVPLGKTWFRFIHLKFRDYLATDFAVMTLKVADSASHGDAARALGQLGDKRAVESLITLLGNGVHWMRWQVAELLGQLGDMRAVEPLIIALGDPDEIVRRNVAQALGQLGDKRAVEPLIRALHDSNKSIRHAAAKAVGQLGETAIQPLLAAVNEQRPIVYKSDFDLESTQQIWIIREEDIVEALEQIGTPEALAAVQQWREQQAKGES